MFISAIGAVDSPLLAELRCIRLTPEFPVSYPELQPANANGRFLMNDHLLPARRDNIDLVGIRHPIAFCVISEAALDQSGKFGAIIFA